MKARIWSYQQLHVHLQHCFAICCLFPKGTCFPSQLLIKFWMAEGFIKPVNKEDRMEDIGENYLNELVCRFFLEQRVDDGQRIYYRLHDLLHDLAERVQGDDFLRIDYTKSRNVSSHISQMLSRTENIRHIYLPASMINKLKDTICLMKNLHTLVCVEANCTISKKVLREILKNSKKMRVLFLPMCGDDLPDCFGNLKLLRLLCFVGSLSFKKLPVSICKLYLLETLALPSCESLPKEFSELICLRHIAMEEETICHISNVGRMTSLQGLSILAIRKKRGHELHQLENLIQLRGTMCITGLENVTSIEDAIKANMLSKSHLEELEFQWNSDERMVDDFQLLDALQPHPNIRGLTIKRFGANRLPNWILGLNSLKHLVELKLIGCTNIEKISSIYESLPNCKLLDLSGLNNLKELPLLPPNLSSLTLHHIPQLGYFSENDLLKKKERKQFMLEAVKQIIGYMKSRYLKLSYEPIETSVRRCLQFVKERLEATPEICIMSSQCENIFTKMKKIDPWNKCYSKDELLEAWDMCMHCHLETMLNKNEESMLVLPVSLTCLVIKACSITSDALSTCIQCLVSLSKLCLVEIQTITSLPPEEALHALKNLRSLHIKRCHLLSSLGGIRALTSLTELTLKGCLNLNSSNEQLPSSLETLKFEECANVDFILDQSDLPALRALEVWEFFYVGHLYEGREKGVLHVGHLPCLQDLTLVGWNGRLEGLNSLTSLYWLTVLFCPGIHLSLPNDKCSVRIENVSVDNPLLLKQMLSDETISSIEDLSIVLFEGDSIDDEVFESLTPLKRLYLRDCNITHIPVHLKNLASLQTMALNNCPNLHEMESLPKNLLRLEITDCPTLLEKFNSSGLYRVWCDEGTSTVKFPTYEERRRFGLK